MIALFVMYAISASTVLIGKQLLAFTTPLWLTGIRTACAGLVFFLYAAYKNQLVMRKDVLLSCVTIALTSFYISNSFKFWALQYSSPEFTATLFLAEPLLALYGAYYLLSEYVSMRTVMGVCLSLCSVACTTGLSMPCAPMSFVPVSVLCASLLFSVYGALHMRALIVYQKIPAAYVYGLSMGIGGILSLVTSCVVEHHSYGLFGNPEALLQCAVLILMSNLIGYTLYTVALKRYSAVLISSGSFLKSFLLYTYYHQLSVPLVCGLLMFVSGLMLLYYDSIREAEQKTIFQ
jgi:drug/metabolite transporter (DMT)-like permease